MEPRTHDWLATLFFSPDKTIQELADYGITTDNSTLYSKDYYKNIPAIQEAFKTKSGEFDHAKFNSFYNDVLYIYNAAEEANIVGNILNTYEYDPIDIFAPIGAQRKTVNATIYQVSNPERRSSSLVSIGGISDPTMSIREVGQTQQVFNWDTKQFEDWSPNDKGGLFSGFSMPTLVLAQWDSDGTHEWNGRVFNHKKGDLKYNEFGDPYYETLGNRPVEGKDILHYSDVLTADGSAWNKYDVFDSDGLDKSIGSTILKTAIKIAPMFIPGFGEAYGYFTAALELGEFLPIIYKSIAGIAYGDTSKLSSVGTANNIQGYFSRFNSSQSDYARQAGFFTVENIGEIASIASLQLFQQKAISKIPGLFSKNKKIIDGKEILSPEAIKWGRGLSFAYMSGTSAQHSYEAFKEAGASDRVAGLGMLSTMWAFYGLMSNNYFNYEEVLFGGSQLSKNAIKTGILESGDEAATILGFNNIEAATATQKGAAKWVIEAKNKFMDWAKKQDPSSILSTAYKEGIEETMEEVFTDGVKGFYSGLNALGIVDKDTQYDFGFSIENMATRYFTSFIGGGIGGTMFGLHNKYGTDSQNSKEIDEAIKHDSKHFQKIVYFFRNGKENEVRSMTDRLWKQKKFGSTNLSGYKFEVVKIDGKNEIKYAPAEIGESQNDLIYKELTNMYDRISRIIAEEGLNISDKEIEAITSAHPQMSKDDAENFIRTYRASANDAAIFSLGLHSQSMQEINSLATEILQSKVKLENMLSLGTLDPKTDKDIEAHIKAVKNGADYKTEYAKLEQLRKKRDAILAGEYNDKYVGLLYFAGRANLAQLMGNKYGKHAFTTWKYGKHYDYLSPEEQNKIDIEYGQYTNIEKADLLKAYDLFIQIQNSSDSLMKEIASEMTSKELLHSGYDEFFVIKQNILAEITENEAKIEKLKKELPEGKTTSDEIIELEQKNNDLNALLESRQYEGRAQILNLSEKGKEILKRNTSEYSNSYLDYLKYILQNGLTLNYNDADMHYILQNYRNQINKNKLHDAWRQYIINKEGSYDGSLDEWFNPIANGLEDVLYALEKGDINTAKSSLNLLLTGDAVNVLEEMIDDFNAQEFWDSLLPLIGSYRLSTYLDELTYYKSLISESPVYQLLENIISELNLDKDIIKLIQTYQKEFLQATSVYDFIIQDQKAIDKLKQIHQVINIAKAIILSGTKTGFNHDINPYRKALGKEVWVELTDAQINNLIKELNLIDTQVETLISIAEKNNSQKLREQKDIELNMRSKFLDALVGEPSPTEPESRKSVVKEKLIKLGINIDDIIAENKLTIPEQIDENNLKTVNQFMTVLETLIYEKAVSLNLTCDQIIETLFSCYNESDIVKGYSTKLSKDPNAIITEYDELIYWTTIFGAPSINFYNRLAEVLSTDEYDKAPIFSQEYATRIIYSFVNNTNLFNGITNRIKAIASKSDNVYIKNKTNLDNMMFILGSAGVGKTTGVAKLAVSILGENSVSIVAPTKEQVDNLGRNIPNASVKLSKHDIRTQLLGVENWTKNHIITHNEVVDGKTVTRSISFNGILSQNPTNLLANKLMIVDEVTLFNKLDLELLSVWAKKNGIKIICLGDPIQNATKLTISNVYDNYSGLEDTWHIKAPRLTAPMRPSNVGKYDNTIRLSTALEFINDEYNKNPEWTPRQIDEFTNQYLPTAPIILKYFEDKSLFFGDRIVSGDITSYIEKFKKLAASGKTAVIITDNMDKYVTYKDELPIIHINQVQGREFDYVIVDVDFTQMGIFDKLRSFYTYTQRSRIGTVIVNNGGIPTQISSIQDISASYNISVSDESVEEFKKWKLSNIFSATNVEITQYDEETTVEDETSNTPTPAIAPADTNEKEISPIITDDMSVLPIPGSNDTIPEPGINTPISPNTTPTTLKQDVNIPSPGKIICTSRDFVEKFDGIYENIKLNLRTLFNSNNDSDIKHYIYLLRAWFLYGHHKTGEGFSHKSITNRRHLYMLQTILSNNPNPKFNIENHILYVELINNDDVVKIPLLYVNNVESGELKNDIEISIDKSSKTFGKHRGKDAGYSQMRIPKHMQVSKIYVWNGPKYEGNEYWAEVHSGKTFVAVNADPFVTNWEGEYFIPTDDANPTTQNASVQLFHLNRLYTWNEIKHRIDNIRNLKNLKVSESIIHGSRVGGIIALAYKLDPNIRINLAHHLTFSNQGIRIVIHNSKLANNKVIDITSIEEFDSIINQIGNANYSIQLTNIKDGKIYVNKIGEVDLIRILKGKNYKFTKWGELEEAINKHPLYKNNIYGQDLVPGNIKGWIEITNNPDMYLSDVDEFYGNDFIISIDGTETTEDRKLVDNLNEQLSKLGYNKIIKSKEDIENVLEEINKEILSKVQSHLFVQLSFNGERIVAEHIDSLNVFIASKLGMLVEGSWENQGENIDYVRQIIDLNRCKFECFSVSLQDGSTQYYVLYRDSNNQFDIRPINQEVYLSWKALALASNRNFENAPIVGKYINNIINNEDVEFTLAREFSNISGEFKDLSTLINNYLLAKLKYDEC